MQSFQNYKTFRRYAFCLVTNMQISHATTLEVILMILVRFTFPFLIPDILLHSDDFHVHLQRAEITGW